MSKKYRKVVKGIEKRNEWAKVTHEICRFYSAYINFSHNNLGLVRKWSNFVEAISTNKTTQAEKASLLAHSTQSLKRKAAPPKRWTKPPYTTRVSTPPARDWHLGWVPAQIKPRISSRNGHKPEGKSSRIGPGRLERTRPRASRLRATLASRSPFARPRHVQRVFFRVKVQWDSKH